jgi:hypothetical protein
MNSWRLFVLGSIGGAVGALAMRLYWTVVREKLEYDPRSQSREEPPIAEELTDISLVGKHHQQGESSTAAMGRILYTTIAGKEPQSDETKSLLSYMVHYGISMGTSGAYSAARQSTSIGDGLLMGAALWFLGDELLQPMLGLTKGPAAYPDELHLYSWGAHLVYGAASSVTTYVLDSFLD